MRALIFDTENQAKEWDWQNNNLNGSISRYLYSRKALAETVTLTKAEYAEDQGIPQTIANESDEIVPNPAYEALDNSYTLHKCALLVGDDLDTVDEEGNVTLHPDVVDVNESDFYTEEGL